MAIMITSEDPEEQLVAQMMYNVGYAMTCWGHVEEKLAGFYVGLCVPKGGRSEAMVATFAELRTAEQKIQMVKKVMRQVLYNVCFNDFRGRNEKRLNRILRLNEIRNQIAHGRILYGGFGGAMGPKFGPYYIEAVHMRREFMAATKVATDAVQKQAIWTPDELHDKAYSLHEGMSVADEMLADFDKLVLDMPEAFHTGGWLVMDRGIPAAPMRS
ncbi:hypothetical protein [Sphingomonas sanguinis]|uniref:Uncharacterized protein n=1 Tax=Sphingomonas sanguinis TaxID=33051 RepID=A0A147J591_9SPHN|nr:hypothetical protein [Sphingomonas sanguinis]KTW09637.1 hypothetical protein NS258_15170 [Sphingomonas sanguinis]